MTKKNIQASGKRKRAVARATIKPGKSSLTINKIAIEVYGSSMARMRIKEPLLLAGDKAKNLNIKVDVNGGGTSGQSDAARLAIAKALVQHDASLKQTFLDYDRQLLVADIRRKESSKPNSHGQARAKRQKSYR